MAARKNSDDGKFCAGEKQQYVIFDCSNHFITALCPRPEDHFGKFDRFKRVAADALDNTRASKRTKSLILNTVSGNSLTEVKDISSDDEESDVKSDAESLPCFDRNGATDVSDDEQWLDNLFQDEGTRKKLQALAGMVGADSMEPEVVLAKVVNVLTGLTRRNE